MGVLRKCLESYEIEWKPYVRGICTVVMGRSLLPGISHKLNDMCDYYGICLNHHPVDLGSLADGGRLMQVGGPLNGKHFIKREEDMCL